MAASSTRCPDADASAVTGAQSIPASSTVTVISEVEQGMHLPSEQIYGSPASALMLPAASSVQKLSIGA